MNTNAICLFYAGVLVQAVFLIAGNFEWKKDPLKLCVCCAATLIGLLPGKHETHYRLDDHLFMMACGFTFTYAFFFKQKILERINKEVLMIWSLVGIYIALQLEFITAHPTVLIFLLALGLLPVANAFAGFDRGYGWKVYFYIWFLCVLVSITASKFAFSTIGDVFGYRHPAGEINLPGVFAIGMSFLYLAVNLWFVIELIPIPGKHQSFSQRMEELKEDVAILAGDYDDRQFRWWKTVLLLAVSGSLLAFNYFRHFVSDEVLIPILIAALPVVDKLRLPAKTKTSVETAMDAESEN
jgi:hypothetical protein